MLKKIECLFALMLLSVLSFSQVGVGPDDIFFRNKVDDFSEESVQKFKSSKTVFLYGEKDDPKVLEELLQSVWTATEISLLHYKEFDSIDFDSTSIFSIEVIDGSNTAANLQLWFQNTNKKGKVSKQSICQIALQANNLIGIADDLYGIRNDLNSKKAENMYSYFYDESRFDNLRIGLLKNYLKVANEFLMRDSILSPYKLIDDNSEVHELKSKTIFIPEYAVKKYNSTTNKYENISAKELAKIFEKYPYKYEVLNLDNLDDRINNSKEPFYYMSYIRTLSSKHITIYNSKSSAIIYNVFDLNYNNLTGADMKSLSKAIDSF